MAEFKITAKNITAVLTEMSENKPAGYFTPADIAVKLISNHFGMKNVADDKKRYSAKIVGNNLRQIMSRSTNGINIYRTDGKVEPNFKHYSSIQKTYAFRIGKPVGEINGNVTEKPSDAKSHLPQNTVMADAMQGALDKNAHQKSLDDCNQAVIDTYANMAYEPDSEDDKMVMPEANEANGAKAKAQLLSLIAELSHHELSEVIMECTVLQNTLFDKSHQASGDADAKIKLINELLAS